MTLAPFRIYDGNNKVDFKIAYQDQVSLIKNGKLVVLKDYDDFYYQLAYDSSGDFEVINLPLNLLKMAMDKKIPDIKCPEEMKVDKKFFKKAFCQKILDLDTNDLKLVQYAWTCP